MKKRIEIKVGEVTASHMSIYSSLVQVASAAFGKGDGKPAKPEYTRDLSKASPEEFAAQFNSMMSG